MLTPAGLGITALGLGKMGYNAIQKACSKNERRAGMSDDEREAYLEEQAEVC